MIVIALPEATAGNALGASPWPARSVATVLALSSVLSYGAPPPVRRNTSAASTAPIVITRATVRASVAIDATGSTDRVTSKSSPERRVTTTVAPSATARKPLTASSRPAPAVKAPDPAPETLTVKPAALLTVTTAPLGVTV